MFVQINSIIFHSWKTSKFNVEKVLDKLFLPNFRCLIPLNEFVTNKT